MKYVKLAMNASAAVFLALFCIFPIGYIAGYLKSFPDTPDLGKMPSPTHFFFIGQFIVFSFLIYQTGKYLYLHFFEQKKFYVHLFLLSVPFLMLFASAAWYYADVLMSYSFAERMHELYKSYNGL